MSAFWQVDKRFLTVQKRKTTSSAVKGAILGGALLMNPRGNREGADAEFEILIHSTGPLTEGSKPRSIVSKVEVTLDELRAMLRYAETCAFQWSFQAVAAGDNFSLDEVRDRLSAEVIAGHGRKFDLTTTDAKVDTWAPAPEGLDFVVMGQFFWGEGRTIEEAKATAKKVNGGKLGKYTVHCVPVGSGVTEMGYITQCASEKNCPNCREIK